ncbi:MAG TPA: bifunctional DNA-formamidopyrimidine glycosylase/DNA-(apurinic or apyrimidinic site) lyase [Smithellaceae bacterium]|nr:bifunctional DNA-formamidopyrimidine glycosylase/DNA-(apurinic or apyrimidinic site) lyase [Smithellaceae bacterium]
MPELPEVETLCRQLQKKIAGKKIVSSEIYDPKLAHVKDIRGNTVTAVRRNGKTVEMLFDDGNSVFIHLRMTGRLLWQEKAGDRPKHSRWRISFDEGNIYLVDPRRFATIKILPTKTSSAGSDILQGFDEQSFIEKHGQRKTKVKNLIMDQRALSGIGNIYACEILHCAGIQPERPAASLTNKDWKKVFAKTKDILQKAIEKRGTSISDWRDLDGRKGENQFELKAYGREGKKCIKCGAAIIRIKQGGRSTFYCPVCQK